MSFADPGPHRRKGYTLTGPRAVTFDEVAGLLTAALGRAVTYQPTSVLGYARHLRGQGLPLAPVAVQTVLHTGLRRGDAEAVDPTLPHLRGRPARTIEDYVHENADTWRRTAK